MTLTHVVTQEEDGLTLQHILRGPMKLSGRQTRDIKKANGVTVNGSPMFSNQCVICGQTVRVTLPDYSPSVSHEGAQPLDVLYEDDALLAVQKPALLQCHPSPSAPHGADTLEGRVMAYLCAPAHPVHRLDAETTGIVLFAKLPYVQAHIQTQMQEGTFHKTYLAWVFGIPDVSVIDAPIARLTPDSFTRIVSPEGQRAISRCRIEKTVSAFDVPVSLVELSPETGRTHQLRVHMAHIGCPLLGDLRYGSPASRALSERLNLHYHQLSAVKLSLIHPFTGKTLSLSCPPDFSFSP